MIDYPGLLRALIDAGVDFIIVGGAAATAHGAARLTQDLDVVYARDPSNLARLATALAPHEPYLRGAPADLPFLRSAVASTSRSPPSSATSTCSARSSGVAATMR